MKEFAPGGSCRELRQTASIIARSALAGGFGPDFAPEDMAAPGQIPSMALRTRIARRMQEVGCVYPEPAQSVRLQL